MRLVRIKVLKNLRNTNKSIIFALSIKKIITMKRNLKLTEKEFDLIETVRNWKKSYPRGEPELRWAAMRMLEELFDELLE